MSTSSTGHPAHPTFEKFDSRLKTYEFCDILAIKMKARDLCEAGFFYPPPKSMKTDQEKDVICFNCGIRVQYTSETDKHPWILHALNNPECQFVLDFKGEYFVTEVLKRFTKNEVEAKMVSSKDLRTAMYEFATTPIRKPLHPLRSDSPKSDSGYLDTTLDQMNIESLPFPDLDSTCRQSFFSSSELDGMGINSQEADVYNKHLEKELEKKAAVVKSLSDRLEALRTNSDLCSTQLSEEVARKQQIFDDLCAKLYMKKSAERQDRISLMQFRREREEVIFQLTDQFKKVQQQFNIEKDELANKTKIMKQHLDNLEIAHNDLVEKYEEKKKLILTHSSKIKSLQAENGMKNEGICKLKTMITKHKLTTMERLAVMAEEIEKKNTIIARMSSHQQTPPQSSHQSNAE